MRSESRICQQNSSQQAKRIDIFFPLALIRALYPLDLISMNPLDPIIPWRSDAFQLSSKISGIPSRSRGTGKNSCRLIRTLLFVKSLHTRHVEWFSLAKNSWAVYFSWHQTSTFCAAVEITSGLLYIGPLISHLLLKTTRRPIFSY
ncbi:hypothetical protein CEXT_688601 [Caerostris extrusa]|uniref:Uncharacterized protein n=1 Tax=Caerostris extrusa TaxID=172846 RepID=A0AAV4SQD1_CAEEX|nr:hypothetical protein CEXT_688601 [Caerostris extrusa]